MTAQPTLPLLDAPAGCLTYRGADQALVTVEVLEERRGWKLLRVLEVDGRRVRPYPMEWGGSFAPELIG